MGRSGGSFGGGRSGGGRSFGGRSSFRGSRSTHTGGSSYRPHGGIFVRNTVFRSSGGSNYHQSSPSGNGRVLLWTILLLLLIVGVTFFFLNGNILGSVEENTTERTPLSGQVNKTDWYEDGIGWITEKQVMISGLEDFYKKTGIQPYVLFVPYTTQYWNGNDINANAAQSYLEAYYDNHFTDEAHFLFAYFACSHDTKSEMDGSFYYVSGYAADTIMDSEALRIFWGYFEKYYGDTSYTIEEMIGGAFSDTAQRIMSRPTNGWDFANMALIIGGICLAGVVLVVFAAFLIGQKQKRDAHTRQILEMPLETFDETDISDLEKKYEEKPTEPEGKSAEDNSQDQL